MISRWVKENPLLAHLIQLLINVILLTLLIFFLLNRYGEKIDRVYIDTNCMKEIIEGLTDKNNDNNE